MKKDSSWLRWSTTIASVAVSNFDSLVPASLSQFYNEYFIIYKPIVLVILLITAGVCWFIHYKDEFLYRYRSLFLKSDVYVYDAAHFLVSGRWDSPQVVGYGSDVGRLMRDGTTLHRSELNVQTGIQKHVMLTPEEEALAIRNTRLENLNRALDEIRLEAQIDLPIWSSFNDSGKRILLRKEYWSKHRFDQVRDLKQASAEKMQTVSHDSDRPFYHTLKTNKKLIEKIWPPVEVARTLYGSTDFRTIRKET